MFFDLPFSIRKFFNNSAALRVPRMVVRREARICNLDSSSIRWRSLSFRESHSVVEVEVDLCLVDIARLRLDEKAADGREANKTVTTAMDHICFGFRIILKIWIPMKLFFPFLSNKYPSFRCTVAESTLWSDFPTVLWYRFCPPTPVVPVEAARNHFSSHVPVLSHDP